MPSVVQSLTKPSAVMSNALPGFPQCVLSEMIESFAIIAILWTIRAARLT
jgi:hypothetical protein